MWKIILLIVFVIVGGGIAFLVYLAKSGAFESMKLRCPHCHEMVTPPGTSLPRGFTAGVQEFPCPACGKACTRMMM